ncbi:hypothetical protein NSMS1_12130 [Nostoc sp. MS1]|nr:hypothetical protein NSMS1_08170 [Nostoc sp. MS1]BCL34766.1 hypothetical protein NSMS1_12130 [Nostoc sp. MS1]
MYRRAQKQEKAAENFELPFGGKLASDNRWVIMANMIPWSKFEAEYAEIFSARMGAPAKTFRMALGALIIKEKLGISDRETVEQIRENPYLQYIFLLCYYGFFVYFFAYFSKLSLFLLLLLSKLIFH